MTEIASPITAEASTLLRLCRRLLTTLWRRLCLDIESAYVRDPSVIASATVEYDVNGGKADSLQ
jgi:hypothetical protein